MSLEDREGANSISLFPWKCSTEVNRLAQDLTKSGQSQGLAPDLLSAFISGLAFPLWAVSPQTCSAVQWLLAQWRKGNTGAGREMEDRTKQASALAFPSCKEMAELTLQIKPLQPGGCFSISTQGCN